MLRPPIGVALLGFVVLMAGFAFTVMGLRFVAAFALWATQPWGWLFTHFLAILGLIDAFFVWIANNSFSDGLAVAIFPLVVIWYLNLPDVKAAFGMESVS